MAFNPLQLVKLKERYHILRIVYFPVIFYCSCNYIITVHHSPSSVFRLLAALSSCFTQLS